MYKREFILLKRQNRAAIAVEDIVAYMQSNKHPISTLIYLKGGHEIYSTEPVEEFEKRLLNDLHITVTE